MTHQQKETIKSLFDNYLLKTNKSFLSLRQANEILKNSSDKFLQEINLKQILENGNFLNSRQTEQKPKQWRIFSSENFEQNEIIPVKKNINKREVKIYNNKINNPNQKRNGIIAISCVIFLLYCIWYNSKSTYTSTSEFSSSQYSELDNNIKEESDLEENFQNKVFTFISLENDKEYINGAKLIQTNKEKTIHKFDFINKIVTCKATLNGKIVTTKYPINGFYAQKGTMATTYVIKVNTLGVKEIWFSPDVPNLGYDYDDGTRIACYELQLKNE